MENPALPPHSINRRQLQAVLLKLLRRLGPFALAGLVGAIFLLGLFAKLTEDIFSNEALDLDRNFALQLHSYANPTLDALFTFFTSIGGFVGIPILAAITFGLLVWRKHYLEAWLVVITVGGGILLNLALKALFHRPRPNFFAVIGTTPQTFSFPSGHATVSMCFFGFLIWLGFKLLKRPLLQIGWGFLMTAIIILIGLSRIYLGVHYLTDVLGGYLSGSFWLIMLLSGATIYQRRSRRQDSRPPLSEQVK